MAKFGLNKVANNYLYVCTARILDTIRDRGLDVEEIYQKAGIGHSAHVFPNSFVTWEHYKRLICYLEDANVIPGIGLLVGSQTQLGDLGVLGYASQSSKTFWEALNIGIPYAGLLGWDLKVEHVKVDPRWTELRILPTTGTDVPRAISDQWITLVLSGAERLIRHMPEFDYGRMQFDFPYPAPANPGLHRKVFHTCDLHFWKNHCAWRYPREWDDIQLPGHDDVLSSVCARQLALVNKRKIADHTIVDKVKAYIYYRSGEGFPDMCRTARHFNMSPATLRRKLKANDVTYEALVEHIRKEMATHLLRKTNLKSEEVAYKLGYKSPSNFYAAFKSWFGCSTTEYRKKPNH